MADRNAELAMRAVLRAACPGCGILGEEFGLERPEARLRWVLDPIDGTRAFITGRPTFGTLVALLDGDTPLLGIIDQPVTGERWIGVRRPPTQFHRAAGRGGRHARLCRRLTQAELSCTSPEMLGGDMPRWQRLAGAGAAQLLGRRLLRLWPAGAGADRRDRRVRPEALGLGGAAAGREGAGGTLTDWQGNPPRVEGDGRVIAVGDPSLLADVVAALGQ